jgi:FKBP-type peptidyl-prolyl cis-trans isomerase SlpA
MNTKINTDGRVLLHLSILLDDGSIADSTKAAGKPALLQLGDDSLSQAMELELIGLAQGDQKKFRLQACDAFGESNQDLIQFMDRFQFADSLQIELGKMIQFEQPNGEAMVGIIRDIQGDSVKVDFNHPLAGEAITFEIEVIEVNPPTRLEAGQGSISIKAS